MIPIGCKIEHFDSGLLIFIMFRCRWYRGLWQEEYRRHMLAMFPSGRQTSEAPRALCRSENPSLKCRLAPTSLSFSYFGPSDQRSCPPRAIHMALPPPFRLEFRSGIYRLTIL